MLKKGLLFREARGLYRANPTIGVGDVTEPLRIQNVRLFATEMDGVKIVPPVNLYYAPHVGYVVKKELPGLGRSKKDVVRLRFVIGSKNKQLTFTGSCNIGFDLISWQFVVDWIEQVSRDYGFTGELNWVADRGHEVFKDYFNINMDGIRARCITIHDFTGYIQKVYQKQYGVRDEYQIERQSSLDSINNILMGGMAGGSILNMNAMAIKNMEEQTRAVKGFSHSAYQAGQSIDRTMPALVEAILRAVNKVEEMQADLKVFKKEMREK